MPQISNKGLELPQSAIRKLVPFSDAAKERGIHVYHLNIGQPDIETPKGALKALSEKALELPETDAFRVAIAPLSRWETKNWPLDHFAETARQLHAERRRSRSVFVYG